MQEFNQLCNASAGTSSVELFDLFYYLFFKTQIWEHMILEEAPFYLTVLQADVRILFIAFKGTTLVRCS